MTRQFRSPGPLDPPPGAGPVPGPLEVAYPGKRTLPTWLAHPQPTPVRRDFRLPSLWLDFWPVSGTFVSDHSSKTAVSVVRVTGITGFDALLFRTAIHEDLDGAPKSYAPPISATNHDPKPGLSPLDHINNATNEKPPTFHPLSPSDPVTTNTWAWTGVVSMTKAAADAASRTVDDRDFLKDVNGKFPLFQRPKAGTDNDKFYAPQTAIATRSGEAVNPLEVPYVALSTSLKERGHVGLGDFGLAIRAGTGASTPLIYADAGGGSSTSVGECSRKLIRNLFGGAANDEKVCFVVFPRSRRVDNFAEPELMAETVQRLLPVLDLYENAADVAHYTVYPSGWAPHAFPTTTAERIAQESHYAPERLNVDRVLRPGHHTLPVVHPRKDIF